MPGLLATEGLQQRLGGVTHLDPADPPEERRARLNHRHVQPEPLPGCRLLQLFRRDLCSPAAVLSRPDFFFF